MTRGPSVAPALRQMLADPTATPRTSDPAAHSAAMLHAHALRVISRLLDAAGLHVMLVKGAALAITVYPDPAARPMTDIDVLVREGERNRVIAALVAGGCEVRREPERRFSAPLMGETGVFVHAGAMRELVEVHTTLSKMVDRPIEVAGLFARAVPAPSLPGLLIPAPEDHALLIAMHAAGHGFAHPPAYVDLELLLRRGIDAQALVERAKTFHLTGVMFAMLTAMRQLGAASVSEDLVSRFDPGPLRRVLVRNAAERGPAGSGLGWVVTQSPLRDDPLAWLAGVGRYASARIRDRTPSPRLASRPARATDTSVPYRMPLWVRAIVALDRVAARVENARAGLRDEALLAWIPEGERTALTAAIYSEAPTYFPGGKRFESGLFTWEHRILAHESFPRSGRVLLGAAGAGRELVALVQRGFEVVGFDPCEPFVHAAGGLAPADKATVVQGSYRDLVDAAAGRGGPLAGALAGSFDAVILGWGSLSHVQPSAARVDLFRALRALAPTAPVLASFGVRADPDAPPPGQGRVRRTLRRVFAALGAPQAAEDSDHFFSHIGFFSYLSHEELLSIADQTGYEVAVFDGSPYGYALLCPKAEAFSGA